MNPVEIGRGHSFKGLASYLLHDAKEEQGQHPATSQRVGWTQSFNLMDAKPDRAWRLMATTAMSADALKDAAGIKKVGAKNKTPVYHFCITWPEEDQPTNAMQRKAVAESLAALKLEGHQALAVQHRDGSPHVHVMVNLINPENGTTPKLSYTHKNLRKWANKFEKTHGLQITEGSHANQEKRRNGERVDARRKPRNVYDQEKREGNDRRMLWLQKASNENATTLQRDNKAMQQRHKSEWSAIKETYYAHREALRDDKDTAIKQGIADTKAVFKSKWAALFKENRERLKQFEKSEQSPALKLFNAANTFVQARKDNKGVFSAIAAASSPEQRRANVERKNKRAEQRLASQLKKEISGQTKEIRVSQDASLTGARETFLNQCDALKISQNGERKEQRQKWRDYNDSRKTDYARMSENRDRDHTQLLRQNESLQQHLVQTRDPE